MDSGVQLGQSPGGRANIYVSGKVVSTMVKVYDPQSLVAHTSDHLRNLGFIAVSCFFFFFWPVVASGSLLFQTLCGQLRKTHNILLHPKETIPMGFFFGFTSAQGEYIPYRLANLELHTVLLSRASSKP